MEIVISFCFARWLPRVDGAAFFQPIVIRIYITEDMSFFRCCLYIFCVIRLLLLVSLITPPPLSHSLLFPLPFYLSSSSFFLSSLHSSILPFSPSSSALLFFASSHHPCQFVMLQCMWTSLSSRNLLTTIGELKITQFHTYISTE